MTLDLDHNAKTWQGRERHYVAYQEVDCSDITVPSDGKVKVMTIPANSYVARVRTKVTTAEGSAADLDVGDSSTVNEFGDALDINSTSTDNFDTNGGNSGAIYTSADYIQFFFKDNGADTVYQASTCVIGLWVELIDFSAQ